MYRLLTSTIASILVTALAVADEGRAPIASKRAFKPYQSIIEAKLFGEIAAVEDDAQANQKPVNEATPEEVKQEAEKLTLCAMTIMPDGRAAVGLIDAGVQPAASLLLYQGDKANGLEVVIVDYASEIATFKRGEILFTLKYGAGQIETITQEMLDEKRAQETAALAKAKHDPKKPRYNSLAEQLIAMEMSLPPDVQAPPLPIPAGVDLTKPFDPDAAKPQADPESQPAQAELDDIVQAGMAELKDAKLAGESPQSYIERLSAHRAKEFERQQAEKAQAKQDIEDALANQSLSEADRDYIKRRTNIELIKKGVVPLENIELTKEEEKELVKAGAL